VAFTTPIFLNRSPFGVYFMFGSAALITVVVCIFFMPETRGKTLEDIDASFRDMKLKNQIELKTPFSGVIERRNMDDEREDSGMDEIIAVSSLSLV
jgi:hypothetical protein